MNHSTVTKHVLECSNNSFIFKHIVFFINKTHRWSTCLRLSSGT